MGADKISLVALGLVLVLFCGYKCWETAAKLPTAVASLEARCAVLEQQNNETRAFVNDLAQKHNLAVNALRALIEGKGTNGNNAAAGN
jgi:cell division protein FtsB